MDGGEAPPAAAALPAAAHYGVDEPSLRAAVARLGVSGHATLSPLLGGMSNVLFLARGAGGEREQPPLVVRLLNPSLDAIIDRAREVRILQRLGAAGVSPRLLGLTQAPAHADAAAGAGAATVVVRGEEYLEGRTLTVRDFRGGAGAGVSPAVLARTLVRMHAEAVTLTGDAAAPAVAWLQQAGPVFDEHMAGYLESMHAVRDAAGGCCCAGLADGELLARPALARERLCRLLHVLDWDGEAAFMCAALAKRGGPLVLAHNDLQPGNWVLKGKIGPLAGGAAAPLLSSPPPPPSPSTPASSSPLLPSPVPPTVSDAGEQHAAAAEAYTRRAARRLDEAELRSNRMGSVSARSAETSSNPGSRRASPTRRRSSPTRAAHLAASAVVLPAAQAVAGAGSAGCGAGADTSSALASPRDSDELMLRIIDLEYAGLNYRAFDLGNLFCEFAINYGVSDFPGFTLTRDEYPGLEAQAEMVEAYAAGWRAEAARRPSMAEDPATSSSGGNGSRHGSGGVGGGGGASEVLAAVPEDSAAAAERWARTSTSPMAIDALLSRRARRASAGEAALEHRLAVEARLGMLASHIYWSAWAAVMAAAKLGSPTAEPAVGFSYSVYGLVRAKEYARMKRQLLLDGGGGAEL